MDDSTKRLEATHEIAQLKSRACRCIDTKDWAGFAALLAEDAHLETDGGVQDGRDTIVASISKALATATTVHQVHAPEITITGPDTATAIWPMNDYVRFPGDGSPFVLRGYGYYHEEYVRGAEGWRIRSSRLERLHVDTEGSPPGR